MATGVQMLSIVWLSGQPQRAQTSPAPLGTVTIAVPPWLWIAIAPAAVTKCKFPAECVAHKCSLSTVGIYLRLTGG